MIRSLCVALFVLMAVDASAQATRIQTSGTLPASCTVGAIYNKTGTDAGFYTCLTTNTWTGPLTSPEFVGAQIANANVGGAAQNSFLVSGGQVVWDDDYDFTVSAASYYIGGVLLTSAQQSISLDSADPTNDRIDVIVVDENGTVGKVTGTAAAQPSEPVIDPGTQLKLAIVTVAAGTTEPPTIATTLLYCDNVGGPSEWNWTTSGTGFNTNSSNNPLSPCTKSIEGTTVTANAYAQGQIPSSTFNPATANFLVFYIRSKAAWNNKRGLTITLRSAGVQIGQPVTFNSGAFGFDSSQTSTYQQIAIPVSQFAITTGTTITQVRFQDFGGSIGFYIGNASFQGGVTTPATQGITKEQADALYQPLGASVSLSSISAALASTTLANGDFKQTWNAALTTAGYALTLGETTAGTGGNNTGDQAILRLKTLTASGGTQSTAVPLYILNEGNAYALRVDDVSGDTTPFTISNAGYVGINSSASGIPLSVGSAGTGTSVSITNNVTTIGDSGFGWGSTVSADFCLNVNNGCTAKVDVNLQNLWVQKGSPMSSLNGANYFQAGNAEKSVNGYYGIGFGFTNNSNNNDAGIPPAFIGMQETDDSTQTKGKLVFATRDVVTNTEPTVRLTINTDGTVVATSNIDAPTFSASGDSGYSGATCTTFTGGLCTTGATPGTLTPDQQEIAALRAEVADLRAQLMALLALVNRTVR